jgi:UDP-GlcNAc:undecaprenyl-phosphate GlcNAc-1-phosphate transferase
MNGPIMNWIVAGALIPSVLISWLAGFAVRRWAPGWGLVDEPGGRKIHRTPTPLGGGLAIALGVVLPLAAGSLALWLWNDDGRPYLSPTLYEWLGNSFFTQAVVFLEPHLPGLFSRLPDLWLLLAAAGLLLLLGLWDDLGGLDWRVRLAIQVLVAAALVYGCGWRIAGFVDWPLLTGALTVLWIVGLVNSFNMLDNMDGLSAGVAAIAAASLAALLLLAPPTGTAGWHLVGPRLFVAGLSFTLVGALLGFLWHNRPPARLFMGDAGSYFVGFLLATATVPSTFAGADRPGQAILAPLCLMAVPIYDMASVVLIRLRAGASPFAADRNHTSHRLVELGLTPPQAVLTIYVAAAICGVAAIVLSRLDLAGAVAILLGIAGLLGLAAMLESKARRKRSVHE